MVRSSSPAAIRAYWCGPEVASTVGKQKRAGWVVPVARVTAAGVSAGPGTSNTGRNRAGVAKNGGDLGPYQLGQQPMLLRRGEPGQPVQPRWLVDARCPMARLDIGQLPDQRTRPVGREHAQVAVPVDVGDEGGDVVVVEG